MKKIILALLVCLMFATVAQATTAQERVKFAQASEILLLGNGMDATVRASGKNKPH